MASLMSIHVPAKNLSFKMSFKIYQQYIRDPFKTVGTKDQGCFSNKGCFQEDFGKAIWKVKGTLDLSYGGA